MWVLQSAEPQRRKVLLMSRQQMYTLIALNKERPSDGLVNDIYKLVNGSVAAGEMTQDEALEIMQSL
ncbi:hypothetical protein RER_24860 [Rhodococcus erythropolis PR4]|uniref:Uncharacterized protein n=2 Tax=Rhodococcus erythropolis TaxID=1833 RepID=C0ZXV9_RHOE4|nr:hypothetical protein RER_24860 [Rhodococcus erythropolis PR4]